MDKRTFEQQVKDAIISGDLDTTMACSEPRPTFDMDSMLELIKSLPAAPKKYRWIIRQEIADRTDTQEALAELGYFPEKKEAPPFMVSRFFSNAFELPIEVAPDYCFPEDEHGRQSDMIKMIVPNKKLGLLLVPFETHRQKEERDE